jgi:hypothetical protein
MRTIVIAALLGPALMAGAATPDTVHLASSLKRVRGRKLPHPDERQRLQCEILKWIDTRISAGVAADKLDRELGAATAPVPEPIQENPFPSLAGETTMRKKKSGEPTTFSRSQRRWVSVSIAH